MLQATSQNISRLFGAFNGPRRRNDDSALLTLCGQFKRQEIAVREVFDQYDDEPPEGLLRPLMDAWSRTFDAIGDTPATTLVGVQAKARALMLALSPMGVVDCEDLVRSLALDIVSFG